MLEAGDAAPSLRPWLLRLGRAWATEMPAQRRKEANAKLAWQLQISEPWGERGDQERGR